MFAILILIVIALLNLAALGLLLRRAYSVDPVYVVSQLDAAIGAIRDDISASAGLTENDVNLLAGLLRIGRRQVINDVVPRLRAICAALDIDDREDFEKRSPAEKELVAQMSVELQKAAAKQST